jgi:WD40 repeat protein
MAVNVDPSKLAITRVKGHQLPITAVRISEDEKFVYSASKDCTIVKCARFLTASCASFRI